MSFNYSPCLKTPSRWDFFKKISLCFILNTPTLWLALGWPHELYSKKEKEDRWEGFLCNSGHSAPSGEQTMLHGWMIQCGPHCAVLALFLLDSPVRVLRCTSREAVKGPDLELLFLPGVGIYVPYSNLTENFTLFLRDLNIFCHKKKNQPRGHKRFPTVSAKLNNLQEYLSEECEGQHVFEQEKQVVTR